MFTVGGRPPRKYASESGWGKNEAKFILKLREAALDARKKAGLTECFSCPVRLDLTVYAPNITQTIAPDHIGDLDALIGGVCESLQAAHPNAPINTIFKGKDEINPAIPLIVSNDSLIAIINAKKIKDDNVHYTVMIEPIDNAQ